MRIDAGNDRVGSDFVAALQHDTHSLAVADEDLLDGSFGANLGAEAPRGVCHRETNAARAALRESPGAERTVDVAYVVVQQDVGRTRRTNAEHRADDAADRHGRLEHTGLEPLVQKVHRTHGHQLHVEMDHVGTHILKAFPQAKQLDEFDRVHRRGVGRGGVDDVAGKVGQLGHGHAELGVDLGVLLGETSDLAPRLVSVGPSAERIAVGKRQERALQRDHLEAVPGKPQLANDVRAKEANDVGADGELESGIKLFGNGRPTEHVTALEHENLAPGLGKISGANEAVVATADYDCVVRSH